MAIGKPNQNIAVLRGLALPTGCSVAIAKLRDCSRSTPKATCAFVLAILQRVGRATPLKTAIFWLGFPIATYFFLNSDDWKAHCNPIDSTFQSYAWLKIVHKYSRFCWLSGSREWVNIHILCDGGLLKGHTGPYEEPILSKQAVIPPWGEALWGSTHNWSVRLFSHPNFSHFLFTPFSRQVIFTSIWGAYSCCSYSAHTSSFWNIIRASWRSMRWAAWMLSIHLQLHY